jgi:hypothetical protein
VPGGDAPREADLDEANWKLSEGLKVCRSVIDNYRSMLSGDVAPTNDQGAAQLGIPDGSASVKSD